MSNCNLCWLLITTSFTKKQTNRNRSASLHLLFAQPVPFPPGFSELWLQNGKGEGWACLSVSCCCTSPVQHGDEPHWISSTSCPPPLCHILKHCPDSSSPGCADRADKARGPSGWEPTTLSVLWSYEEPTLKFGPKSSQLCLLGKDP